MITNENIMNSSISSEDRGNTINPIPLSNNKKFQISPSIRWCFTFNNYTNEDIKYLVPKFRDFCKFSIVGEEIGESGTPHLQGYFEFKTKRRPLAVFDLKKIHFEKAKGSKNENIDYCKKESKLLNELCINYKPRRELTFPWSSNMKQWQKDILDIVSNEPDDRSIYWYWSNSGNIGKTQFCKYLTVNHGAICLSGKGSDVRNGIVEYKKINDDFPEIVLFPIPRSYNSEYLSYEALENIKDMYFYSGKYEGGMICGPPPHLIVFSNEEPDLTKCSLDRWNIVNIDE